jgi:hypothetical protein
LRIKKPLPVGRGIDQAIELKRLEVEVDSTSEFRLGKILPILADGNTMILCKVPHSKNVYGKVVEWKGGREYKSHKTTQRKDLQ